MAEEFILSGMEPWSFRVGYIDVSDARMFRLEREDARRQSIWQSILPHML